MKRPSKQWHQAYQCARARHPEHAGARSLEEFHRNAVVGVQSQAGYEEGRPVRTSW